MSKNIIVVSNNMRMGLDDNYTLYEDGTVLREYDKSIYPNGLNLEEELIAAHLKPSVKKRLIEAATEENKDLVLKLLALK